MFKAHKSKAHKNHSWKRFKSEIIGCDHDQGDAQEHKSRISHADYMAVLEEASEEISENDIHDLEKQLEHKKKCKQCAKDITATLSNQKSR